MQYDERREKAIEKILGTKSIKDFLIEGDYYGTPMNKELPANTEAWKLYDMSNIYLGAYGQQGFNECCLEDAINWGLNVNNSQIDHFVQHVGKKVFDENSKKGRTWFLYCLNNENVNKINFMSGLVAIKYPKVLDRFFANYQNDPKNVKGSLEKAYSVLPWSLSEAKKITSQGDRPATSAIYQFIEHFPVELDNNSYWLKDQNKLEEVLSFVENNIRCGIIPEIITDIWNFAKVELPKAFEFNPNCSSALESLYAIK